jgi:hypothetical protein
MRKAYKMLFFFSKNMKGRDHFGDPVIDKVILKERCSVASCPDRGAVCNSYIVFL